MISRLLSITAAASVALGSSVATAESVTLTNDDGTEWVMFVQPAPGAPIAKPTAGVNDSGIVIVPAADVPPRDNAPAPVAPASVEPAKEAVPATEVPPAPAPVIASDRTVERFGMTIIPRGQECGHDLTRRYREIYNAIPFNRAEYVANPSYRHDATMQLLTGQPQPGGGKTGKTLAGDEYTGFRPYLPSRADYYRFRLPYGYSPYGLSRLPVGWGF